MPIIETRSDEFGKGFMLIFTVCVFAGALLIIVVPDNTHQANRPFAERSISTMPTSDLGDNYGRAPPRSSRSSILEPVSALDEMFRYAAYELRRASRSSHIRSRPRMMMRRR